MSNDLQQQIQPHMSEITHAKGLVFDLRNNSGGNSAPGSWFASHLYDKPTSVLQFRLYSGNNQFGAWEKDLLAPIQPRIVAPTAVLINGENASSAEMFIAHLEAAPNVRTFGTRSMGADGHPQLYPVISGVQVQISSWQERVLKTGQPIEQVGIAPQQPVEENMPDFCKYLALPEQGRDLSSEDDVLQAGIQWILSEERKNP
ncbi:S41 family peptidase [Alicyclobacillus dauci]|uniref:S41 family peptidase n=1 Tax=Alicyclobacillus dauci TaxID=1475485 RepID=A0ABY6Z567_9BACL|nr:S41 family peptidase [Alicyclobacillus dauci]WAH37813.1 S41 family peptidase [Alicyclobacillus dauci]